METVNDGSGDGYGYGYGYGSGVREGMLRAAEEIRAERDESCIKDLRGLDEADDARRYRWLAGDVPQHSTRWQRWKLEHWHGFHGGWRPLTGSELDEAIDAAMETENAK